MFRLSVQRAVPALDVVYREKTTVTCELTGVPLVFLR
jgi:hypothetical protein